MRGLRLALLSTLAAAAAPAQPPRFSASNTAAAHRIAVPGGAISVRLSALEGTLELLGSDRNPLAARIADMGATPCRQAAGKTAVFTCSTALLDAALVTVRGKRYLDLRELRGLPSAAGDEGPPEVRYPLEQLGHDEACPGDSAAARGECAFEAGETARAEEFLTAAKGEEEVHRFSTLRLGDLAIARGDADQALGWWREAAGAGPWGRLATVRVLELTGIGLFAKYLDGYDTAGLPDALRRELELRRLRVLALLRRWDEALPLLGELAATTCETAPHHFCHRVLLAALRSPAASRELALEAYLKLPVRTRGPMAAPLARAAAAAAGELGAPRFGATLLAATVRESAPSELEAQLRQAFKLYVDAGDPVRAQVIADYAQSRLPGSSKGSQPAAWPLSTAGAAPVAVSDAALAGAASEADDAAASLAVARSTLLRARMVAAGGRR